MGDSITKINAFLAFLFHNIFTVFCYPDAVVTEDCKDVVKKESKKRIYFGNRIPIPMVCRLCGEGAPTTNKLAAHFAECHSFEKPFWCHQCNIGYETYYGIQNHNRKDHSEERHLCP